MVVSFIFIILTFLTVSLVFDAHNLYKVASIVSEFIESNPEQNFLVPAPRDYTILGFFQVIFNNFEIRTYFYSMFVHNIYPLAKY